MPDVTEDPLLHSEELGGYEYLKHPEEIEQRYQKRIDDTVADISAHMAARPKDSFAFAVQPGDDFPFSFGLASSGHSESAQAIMQEIDKYGHSQSSVNASFFAAVSQNSDKRQITFEKIEDQATVIFGAAFN